MASEMAVSVGSSCSAIVRLTPEPTTMPAGVSSERMPHTLRLSMSTSLGHLSETRDGSATTSRRARVIAAPARRGIHPHRSCGTARGPVTTSSSTEAAIEVPAGALHVLPKRPRPSVWVSVTSTERCGQAPGASAARAINSAFVEPTASRHSTRGTTRSVRKRSITPNSTTLRARGDSKVKP